jgi:hypothetical protein
LGIASWRSAIPRADEGFWFNNTALVQKIKKSYGFMAIGYRRLRVMASAAIIEKTLKGYAQALAAELLSGRHEQCPMLSKFPQKRAE